MKSKLTCFIVITALLCVILSVFMFGITSSAEVVITENAVLIEAGTYRFNNVLSFPTENLGDYIDCTFTFDFNGVSYTVYSDAMSVSRNESLTVNVTNITPSFDAISTGIVYLYNIGGVSGVDGWQYASYGVDLQTFTVVEDTILTGTSGIAFGTWFRDNTSSLSPTTTVTFESGYYDLKVPYVNLEPSWIGNSGQSVYYPIQCQIVNGFNNYVDCNGFGIEYISNEFGFSTLWFVDIAGLRYDWFILNTIQGTDGVYRTNLQYLGGDAGLTSTKIFFPTSFEMDQNGGGLQFFSTFETTDAPPYEGNVFFDIVDAVVEALDVDVFGYFSPLDVIKSIAGLMLGLWLLKLLAGG